VKTFNLRVYGLLINNNRILVSDECRNGFSFTKFPGGGIEFGEGIQDALIREFMEEMDISIQVEKLFYVNEFLQFSAFNENHQLISFYYLVSTSELVKIKIGNHTVPHKEEGEKHRWIQIEALNTEDFTFPIDQKVVQMIKNEMVK
jgi:ADP-ribose pyrophosphatase YjhB (NUDIX family)